MPTYEYACKSCGEHLEVVQSFKDAPLTECPACGGPLRKVFGSIGIVFKGSGFYRTDSRTPSKPAPKGDAAKGESKSESKAESKTESKAEAGGGGSEKPASDAKAKTAEKSA
jgi:putative FmdB family regulatory protein